MSFTHEIEGVPYEVVAYRLDDSIVDWWMVTLGGIEIPYHHMSDAVQAELVWQCRLDADADNKINREDHGANLALDLEAA